MSEEDPREELEKIIELYKKKHLPKKAYDWASDALETAESIIETIEDMQANGHDAPTSAQEEALENIYTAACNWLRI
jgi:two-component SAPR family response regulator